MTRKIFLIAGVAGIALATPLAAERGGNSDRETRTQASQEKKAQRTQKAERTQRAERPQRAERTQRVERTQRAERPQRAERQRTQRAERPQRSERIQRAERPQRVERQRVQKAERSQRIERPQRVERQRIERAERPQRVERQRVQQAERSQKVDRQRIERAERPQRVDRREALVRNELANVDQRRALREDRRDTRVQLAADSREDAVRLFRERPMRPMKFKGDQRIIAIGDRIDPVRYTAVPTIYRTRYIDTPDYYYRYDDDLGYVYRIDRDDDFVRAMIPLFGGYGIGDPWPRTYYSSYVPMAYQPYYYDTPNYYYRTDGYGIYRIDAGTQLITSLVALLAGQGYGVGQMLPSSYGVYNVPMGYRSTYFDSNDAWYRYGDGYIYQMDPYSRRVAARYPLYTDQYLIGQSWPVAYPDYNVPYGYQSLYYDTPQYHYRYANGGIYQVDPTTQVIMALAALVTGQPMAIGQPMPTAYSTYNVPLAYRDRYYDSNDDWYRYADGYIYRVDPYNGLIQDAIPVYA